MQIKVCGITQLKQLQQLDGLDIEFAGLIFYPESPRYMKDKINAKELRDADLDIKKTGVFVNADYDQIMAAMDEFMLDAVQLHGDETPAFCKKLADKTELIKAFRLSKDGKETVDELVESFDEVCDYYLFDTSGPKESFGGSGESFDWSR
ncbi:MAG TPA: phosphoribosylanthranilate isomerase, partial [Chitinophagaceae bacterium]|nr:phosphoribosylanthranilate isomerase [Chitinophagaceae bacterium]